MQLTRATLWLQLCLVAIAASTTTAQLNVALERAVQRAQLGEHGVAGIAVYDVTSGAQVFVSNADTALAPASNMKLLTSAAAIMVLGPDHTFKTHLGLDPQNRLIVQGSGDPSLFDERSADADPACTGTDEAIAAAVSALGEATDAINGIIVDGRVFDSQIVHPDWPADQLDRWYCAPVAGVNAFANVLAFYPAPRDGDVVADTEPTAPWITIQNRASVIADGRNAVWIQRTDDRTYTLRGRIRSRAGAPIEIALQRPSVFTGMLLADRLENAGVRVDGEIRLADQDEQLPLASGPLATLTTSLATVLYRCNYDSMNLHAEAIVKTLGKTITGEAGSWTNGTAVMRMLIAEVLGAEDAASTTIRDGSGLSRQNRITASTMARWLVMTYRDEEIRAMYRRTLPSLENKLQRRLSMQPLEQTVLGKTGTILHVRCLSGYVINEETGQTAAYAILCNGLRTSESVRASYRLKGEIIQAINDNIGEFASPEDLEALPAMGG
ncbi:MAG: D-alanyl-D-alanine carboxypeptidase/D-alanyl-D-alanine-endopeptidase [Planctomycetota bacterium]